MRCRWCRNDNIVSRPACTHCGEEVPRRQDRREPVQETAPNEPSVVVEAWKSAGVALVMFVALVAGGRFAVTNWPETYEAPETTGAAATGDAGITGDSGTTGDSGITEEISGIPVSGFLAEIQATRSKLPDTLGDCVTVESDLPVLREVTEERRTQAQTAASVDFGAAPDADALRNALVEMTRLSLVADEEYIRWADDSVSTGTCTHAADDGAITSANTAAEEAKQTFVELWNANAQTQGGPTYTWSDF